jgi:hypothetical protein
LGGGGGGALLGFLIPRASLPYLARVARAFHANPSCL